MDKNKKEYLYITDISLHVQECEQTFGFSKVAEKGRFYSPIPANCLENINEEENPMKITIELPQDLKEKIAKGEVVLMIPKGGLPIYAGKDLMEFIKSFKGKRILRRIAKNKSIG